MATKKQDVKKTIPLIENDPWLAPFEEAISYRMDKYFDLKKKLCEVYGSIYDFASMHLHLGVTYAKDKKGWFYREWAPQATSLHLIGDFNEWNRNTHPLNKDKYGIWEIFLPEDAYKDLFVHGSRIKVLVNGANGTLERIPALIQRAVQDEETKDFAGQVWLPKKNFPWGKDNFNPGDIGEPIIYEAHVGMGTEAEATGTYKEFTKSVLPRIKAAGYNAIQLMAVQEHPYYGSFGYHVSSFFAPSSRFGTPEDLKNLIKEAHKMGIAVIMDIVHSHAVKNLLEGLNEFDGTDYQYFHAGGRGDHPGWDSKLFNYGKWEVLQFLLSNVRYWLEEFHFDGFRFDGVTSMLYLHHGNVAFDHYERYFNQQEVDAEAITYLQLANQLVHQIKPNAITIAEDVSGMPGLCRPVEEGGLGFDYRLGMGIPDYWIKLLKHFQDEHWNIWEMWNVMTNRRHNEKTIAYAESHDQALVGDKTIAFWLMDKEMYFHMQKGDTNLIVDRGIALHKLIRMFTISLGGEGYLNFMGNEFGHPEWVDFPREGNNWSHKYARRQWSLADNKDLKYHFLSDFDREMISLVKDYNILGTSQVDNLNMDETNKTMIYKRGELIFVLNFHPSHAIPDYRFVPPSAGKYKIILCSDEERFGGFGRVNTKMTYQTNEEGQLSLYVTNRTAIVLKKVK